jgi:pilus assembly protein CpaC
MAEPWIAVCSGNEAAVQWGVVDTGRPRREVLGAEEHELMWWEVLADVGRRLAVPKARSGVTLLSLLALACVHGSWTGASPAQAQDRVWENERVDGRQLVVIVNKSRTIRIVKPFASAIVGATDIAEALPMSEHSLYVQGKKVGTTNLSIFDADKKLVSVIDVDVRLDTEILREKIAASTGSRNIRVSSSNGQIVLSGQVQNALIADQAMTLARSMAGTDSAGKVLPVANAMSIASAQQVMLRVRFIEATRTAGRDLGVNWFASSKNGNRGVNTGLGGALPGPVSQAGTTIDDTATGPGRPTPGGLPLFQTLGTFAGTVTSAPFGVALARVLNNGSGNIDLLITALETKGLIRRLAEPDLVALSGDSASFIAGGQIPVPSVQPSAGSTPLITTEYKPFGVQLTFVPTVLANGVINLRLTPSVSQLDFANAVVISGFRIPALTLREARTTVELRDGQSFSIAGLLQNDGLRDISEVPWLGSVPVLGALFRSTSYQQSETDLVVIVTAHLVAPGVPGQKIATPLDSRAPSNDVDLFVLGQTDVRKNKSDDVVGPGASDRGPPTGYIMPIDAK